MVGDFNSGSPPCGITEEIDIGPAIEAMVLWSGPGGVDVIVHVGKAVTGSEESAEEDGMDHHTR